MKTEEFLNYIQTKQLPRTVEFSNFLENTIQIIVSKINYISLNYQHLFDSFCYSKKQITHNNLKQKTLIYIFLYITNYILTSKKHGIKLTNKNNIFIFILKIIGKIFQDNLIDMEVLIIYADYLVKTDNIEYLIYLNIFTNYNAELSKLIIEIPLEGCIKQRIKKHIYSLTSNQTIQFISSLMSLNKNKYKPYNYFSELFKFDFNSINILFLTNCLENDTTTGIFLSKMENVLSYLISVIKKEHEILVSNKEKIMEGLLIKNTLRLSSLIDFNEDKYVINFTFSYYNNESTIQEKQYILGLSEEIINPNIYKLCFYIFKNQFFIVINKKEFKFKGIEQLTPETTYNVEFSFKKSGFFSSGELVIKINSKEQKDKINESFDGKNYVYIGKFFGEIHTIEINNSLKSNTNSCLLLKICPKLIYENFQLNKQLNDFVVISNLDEEIKLCKLNKNIENEFYDIPFQYKITKNEFLNDFGLDYLNLMMVSLLNYAEKNNDMKLDRIKTIYSCVELIFTIAFEIIEFHMNSNEKLSKGMSLFYSFTRLMNSIAPKQKLIKTIKAQFFSYTQNIQSKRLVNKIYMLLFNPNYNQEISEELIQRFRADINILNECNPQEIEYYLKIFTNSDIICEEIIKILLNKAKSEYIINYLLEALDMSLDENKYNKCIKLLSILYNSNKNDYDYSNEEQAKLLKKFSEILSHDNNDNEYQLIKAISILLFNDICMKKAIKKNKIFYGNASIYSKENNDNENFDSKYFNQVLFEQLHSSTKNITIPILKAFLLIPFDHNNKEETLDYLMKNTKCNPSSILFENIYSYEIIYQIFSIINHIINNKEAIKIYKEFLSTFINYIISKSSEDNSKAKNIFRSFKIFGQIFESLLTTTHLKQIIFQEAELNEIIKNSIYIHSEPFYFELLIKIIKNVNSNSDVIVNYIEQMINTIIEKTKFYNKDLQNIHIKLNHKNTLQLFHKILHPILNAEDSRSDYIIFHKIFTLFINYLKINKQNPILYIKTKFSKLSMIEIIFEIFHDFFMKIKCLGKNSQSSTNDLEDIIQLYEEIIFPNWIKNEKKKPKENKFCIFFYMDKSKKKSIILKDADIIEKELNQKNEGTPNTYLYTFVFLQKITMILMNNNPITPNEVEESELYKKKYIDILKKIQDNLITIINKRLSQLHQITIDNNDQSYIYFKSEILKYLKTNNSCINLSFIKQIISQAPSLNTQHLQRTSNCDKGRKSLSSLNSNSSYTSKPMRNSINTDNNIDLNPNTKQLVPTITQKINTQIDQNKQYNAFLINESLWYNDINDYGIKCVHNYKTLFYKNLYACYNVDEFYKDKHNFFINKVLPLYNKYNSYVLDCSHIIPYPTKTKNYVTNSYEKPFLKLNRRFYLSNTINVSHNYLNKEIIEQNIKNSYEIIKHKMIFNKKDEYDCELITNEGAIYCKLYLGEGLFLIQNVNLNHKNQKEKKLISSMKYIDKIKYIIIYFKEIKEIISRTFLFEKQSCEITTTSHKTYLLNFFDKNQLDNFYQALSKEKNINITPIENLQNEFQTKAFLSKWLNHGISTYNFLNLLNKYSSRSYNNLSQYPIFPWICNSYKKLSDFEESSKIRLFEYLISFQTQEQRENFLKKQEIISKHCKDKTNSFNLFSAYFSVSAILFYYLVRISPFTEKHITFQSGKFDEPGRMFSEIGKTRVILEKINDNRELIPELFNLPELFYNINLCNFGIQNNKPIHNLTLPINCENGFHFIYLHRKKLESEEIGLNINKWINNVFGCYNQYHLNKNEKNHYFNKFTWQIYWDSSREKMFELLSNITKNEEDIIQLVTYKLNYGNSPDKLITAAIDTRKTIKDNNLDKTRSLDNNLLDILDPQNIREKINSNECKTCKYKCVQKLSLEKFNEENDLTITFIIYLSTYIVVINSYNHLLIYNNNDFELQWKISLGKYFTFLTKQCIIEINTQHSSKQSKKFPTLLISNFTDSTIKYLINQNKYSLNTNKHIISAIYSINSNSFWTGTTKGSIIKYQIINNNKSYNLIQTSPIIINHFNSIINSIIFNKTYDIIISIGKDNKIMIRNSTMYELLNVIELKYSSVYEIELNEYNALYIFDSIKHHLSVYTINGMKICKNAIGINKDLCTFINKERIFYYDKNNYKLKEVCLYEVSKLQNEWTIWFGNKCNVEYFYYCKQLECFDFWNKNGNIWRVWLREENGKKKPKEEYISNNNENIEENDEQEDEPKGLLWMISNALSYS